MGIPICNGMTNSIFILNVSNVGVWPGKYSPWHFFKPCIVVYAKPRNVEPVTCHIDSRQLIEILSILVLTDLRLNVAHENIARGMNALQDPLQFCSRDQVTGVRVGRIEKLLQLGDLFLQSSKLIGLFLYLSEIAGF